jgi:hypothetical protein
MPPWQYEARNWWSQLEARGAAITAMMVRFIGGSFRPSFTHQRRSRVVFFSYNNRVKKW